TAHTGHELALLDRKLCLSLFLLVLVAILAHASKLGTEREVLDLHLALGLLVAALDDDARRGAFVGIFHLRAELARPKIKLGAEVSGAQPLPKALIAGDAILLKQRHDDRPGRGLAVDLADELQPPKKPRHADGKSGRWHRLAAKARDEAVIAPAAADRTET